MKLRSLLKTTVYSLAYTYSIIGGNLFADKEESSASKNQERQKINSLVLSDNSIQQVIKLYEKLTGKMAILANDLPNGTVNFNSQGFLYKDEAIVVLESLLSMNNVSVNDMGPNFFTVVQKNKGKTQGVELLEDGAGRDLHPTQKIYTKIFKLKHLIPTDIMSVLYPMVTPISGGVSPLMKSNSVLVTDSLTNIKKIERVLKEADALPKNLRGVYNYQLKHMAANDLQQKLKSLQNGALRGFFGNTTEFTSDERTNQLFVFTPEENLPMIEEIVQKMDVDVASLMKSELFKLHHAESKTVAEMIRSIISDQNSKKEQNEGKSAAQDGQNNDQKSSQDSGNSLKFSKSITIQPDERSNAIVAYGTPGDLKQISDLIEKLDVVLRQVRIEVLIAEVTLKKGDVSGLTALDLKYNDPSSNGKVSLGNASLPQSGDLTTPTTFSGLISKSGAKITSFNALLKQVEQKDRTKLLAAPIIMTTHNKEASLVSGEKRPVVKNKVSEPSKTTDGGTTINESVSYENIDLTLKVKPLIGENGVVQLEIDQKYDTLVSATTGTSNNPTIGKREAKSFVSVNDGEIIAIGGLQKRENNRTRRRVFLLGYLPVIGEALFSPKGDSETVTDLVIFLKPTVVPTPYDARILGKEDIDNNGAKEEIEDFYIHGGMNSKRIKNYNEEVWAEDQKKKRKSKRFDSEKNDQVDEPKKNNVKAVKKENPKPPRSTKKKISRSKTNAEKPTARPTRAQKLSAARKNQP